MLGKIPREISHLLRKPLDDARCPLGGAGLQSPHQPEESKLHALFVKGFRPDILRRLVCFNLFWHALDIIWVALFTVVYLIGLGR